MIPGFEPWSAFFLLLFALLIITENTWKTWARKGREVPTVSGLLASPTPRPAWACSQPRQHSLPSLPGLPLKLPPGHMCQSWILDRLQSLLLHSGSQAVEQNASHGAGWTPLTEAWPLEWGCLVFLLDSLSIMVGWHVFYSSQVLVPKPLLLLST